jgi:hypothetical protein
MTMVQDDLSDEAPDEFPVRRIKFSINGRKKLAEVSPGCCWPTSSAAASG